MHYEKGGKIFQSFLSKVEIRPCLVAVVAALQKRACNNGPHQNEIKLTMCVFYLLHERNRIKLPTYSHSSPLVFFIHKPWRGKEKL